MAGRPTAGGSTGLLVGMCISIGVALIALVLLVILWTNQEDLKKATASAKSEANRVISAGELGSFKPWYDQANESRTLAKLMHADLTAMAELMTSENQNVTPNLAGEVRKAQLEGFWSEVKSDGVLEDTTKIVQKPLIQALKDLYSVYKNEKELRLSAESNSTEVNQQLAQMTEANKQLQEQFDSTSGDLQARVAAIESEWAQFRDEKQKVIDDNLAANTARAVEENKAKDSLRGEIDALTTELVKKQEKNKELQDKIREFQILPQPRMAARQADGRILRAKPGERSVFVDLGEKDHLALGLRFAVYQPDPGIPSSGEAKAAVEIVHIGEEVTECRIVWMNPLFPILPEDLIANPIYDRQRQMSFVVMGEFDLDYDGMDDRNGPETIAAVIKEMGGVIADELSARTDFVIVGASPLVSQLSDNPSPEELAIQQDQKTKLTTYTTDLQDALSLSIPLLTQETFLNFLARRPDRLVSR